jgi:hypothetical protein
MPISLRRDYVAGGGSLEIGIRGGADDRKVLPPPAAIKNILS